MQCNIASLSEQFQKQVTLLSCGSNLPNMARGRRANSCDNRFLGDGSTNNDVQAQEQQPVSDVATMDEQALLDVEVDFSPEEQEQVELQLLGHRNLPLKEVSTNSIQMQEQPDAQAKRSSTSRATLSAADGVQQTGILKRKRSSSPEVIGRKRRSDGENRQQRSPLSDARPRDWEWHEPINSFDREQKKRVNWEDRRHDERRSRPADRSRPIERSRPFERSSSRPAERSRPVERSSSRPADRSHSRSNRYSNEGSDRHAPYQHYGGGGREGVNKETQWIGGTQPGLDTSSLRINNLPQHISKKALFDHFSQYGHFARPMELVRLRYETEALIWYRTEREARAAIRDNDECWGRKLRFSLQKHGEQKPSGRSAAANGLFSTPVRALGNPPRQTVPQLIRFSAQQPPRASPLGGRVERAQPPMQFFPEIQYATPLHNRQHHNTPTNAPGGFGQYRGSTERLQQHRSGGPGRQMQGDPAHNRAHQTPPSKGVLANAQSGGRGTAQGGSGRHQEDFKSTILKMARAICAFAEAEL